MYWNLILYRLGLHHRTNADGLIHVSLHSLDSVERRSSSLQKHHVGSSTSVILYSVETLLNGFVFHPKGNHAYWAIWDDELSALSSQQGE